MVEKSRNEPTKSQMYSLQLIAAASGATIEELGKKLVAAGEFSSIPKVPNPPHPARFVIHGQGTPGRAAR